MHSETQHAISHLAAVWKICILHYAYRTKHRYHLTSVFQAKPDNCNARENVKQTKAGNGG